MINIKEVKKVEAENALHGAWVGEYEYDDMYGNIEFKKEYRINDPPNAIHIDSDNKSRIGDNLLHLDLNVNIPGKGTVALTVVNIYDGKKGHCVPFKEYRKEKMITPTSKSKAEKCNILRFEIVTKSTSCSDENEWTNYNSYLEFSVGVNYAYIYIIQTPDTSLPTVLVCASQMVKSDFVKILFVGNIYDNIYNSYFHEHQYIVEKVKSYPSTVYGAPGIFSSLKFNESITKEHNTVYETNDGLKATLFNDEVSVEFNNYPIGTYKVGEDNKINSINLLDYALNMNIFNDMHKVAYKLSIHDMKKMYPYLNYIFPYIPVDENQSDRIEKIETDDGTNIWRFQDYSGDDSIRIVFRTRGDHCMELVYINNGPVGRNVDYSMYCLDKRIDIHYIVDENLNLQDNYYVSTPYRTINYFGDNGAILYTENCWIDLDKNNIVKTNLPIEGKFTEYNIFGVPKNL